MTYDIDFKPQAVKDLKPLPKKVRKPRRGKDSSIEGRPCRRREELTDYTPEYRLRIGDYRVLFEVEDGKIAAYRIVHRKNAYQ